LVRSFSLFRSFDEITPVSAMRHLSDNYYYVNQRIWLKE